MIVDAAKPLNVLDTIRISVGHEVREEGVGHGEHAKGVGHRVGEDARGEKHTGKSCEMCCPSSRAK